MDGFDDLLSSSSRALEANPFADPFARPRSSSPDPWASFSQSESGNASGDLGGFAAHYENRLGSHHIEDGLGREENDAKEEQSSLEDHEDEKIHRVLVGHTNGGELESSAHATNGTPTLSPSATLSPGFRESISREEEFSEDTKTETKNDLTLSPHLPSVEVPGGNESEISRAASPPISSTSLGSPPPFPLQPSAFTSPLDSAFSSAIDRPFASLALGGESAGGWQDERVTAPHVPAAGGEETVPDSSDVESLPPTPLSQGSSPTFIISVDDPQKVGDAIRPYVLYTVRTKTTSPLFSKPLCSVLRRYSDFLWLYETLSLNNPGVVVPPVPEKSSFGRFESHFIQQRRMGLERCIQKIASHPVLAKDPDLRFFLESDSFALDMKHRKTETIQDRGGIMSSIGQSITGSKFYEVDEWFDKKKAYLDNLEIQLKALVKAIETVSKQRADLATATGEFALSISELSTSELNPDLSHSLSSLADVEKRSQEIYNIQAQEDINTFLSTADEYARLINSVRLAFVSRIRCHTQWQNTEAEARRIKSAQEKNRSSGKIPQDRIGQSLSQVADAERRSIECKQDFDRCSKLIKVEFGRFEEERINDFKCSLEDLLSGMIQRQKETINAWAKYQEMLQNKVQGRQRASRLVEEAPT